MSLKKNVRTFRRLFRRSRSFRILCARLLARCALLVLLLVLFSRTVVPQIAGTLFAAASDAVVTGNLLYMEQPDAPLTVVLDAGHGGNDKGCHRGEVYEKDITLDIALRVRAYLENAGVTALLTREEDRYLSLEERVSFADKAQPDLFLSIHINALENDNVTGGIEVFCDKTKNAKNVSFALDVANALSDTTNARLRKSVTDSDLYVVSHTLVPSCLIEVGFLTCDEEFRLLTTDAYRDSIARGLADGILSALR